VKRRGGVRVRDASLDDVDAIARIGSASLIAQYGDVVDRAAVDATIEQTYSKESVSDSLTRCVAAADAEFLVAERDGAVRGFLHYDAFGTEPELHRLYVDATDRGAGVGGALIEELHARLGPSASYMLLVMEGNDRAVRFYQRHGAEVETTVDGLSYYAEHMGVEFPPDISPFRLILMRRSSASDRP
jgi:ribosomal protein S18 acetylase RimI-like enzyme